MNPFEEFKKEKIAWTQQPLPGFGKAVRSGMSGVPGRIGESLVNGMTGAVAAAGVAGIGLAASKIVDALTKKRDFNQMLESNPDLIEHHQANPKQFNQMFSTLRMMNPQFSADPIVAGTYMRRMAENPLTAGGVAVEALGHRDASKSPIGESFMGAAKTQSKPNPSSDETKSNR